MNSAAPLKAQLTEAVKAAMRAGDRRRLAALRLIMAELKQREVDGRAALSDEDTIAVLSRMLKQRRESIQQYEQAKREDLAEQERFETVIIGEFLPRPLTDDEITAAVDAAIAETGASSLRDMGKVMNALRPKLQGRADMASVSAQVKTRLGTAT